MFNALFEVYGHAGAFGVLLFAIVGVFVYPAFVYYKKWIDSNISGKRMDLTKSISILRIENMLHHTVPRLRIYCPLRKAIFVKILTIKIQVSLEILKELAIKDLNKMNHETFLMVMQEALEGSFLEAERRMVNAGIPQAALEKFSEMNAINENMIKKTISNICLSERIFDNNVEKAAIIFNMCEVVASTMLVAAEQTIDSLNGQLTGVVFNDIRCLENCPDCKYKKSHNKKDCSK
jgi:hypothetical protein